MANASKRKGPKKSSGEIGATRISKTSEGMKADVLHTELPDEKGGLEEFFARRFQQQFNETTPLGSAVTITDLVQNDTDDLDFTITCSIAKYLELAELNPRSEEFGRVAYRTGKLNVYTYARWIYQRVVRKKARQYGPSSQNIMLLLYVTHWQFRSSAKVIECLRSLCLKDGCDFAGVFVFMTNGVDLMLKEVVYPYLGPVLPPPRQYEGITLTNLEPGRHTWKTD